VIEAAGVVAAGDAPTETLVDHVERQLVEILNLDACVFRSTMSSGLPVCGRTGQSSGMETRLMSTDPGYPLTRRFSFLHKPGAQ